MWKKDIHKLADYLKEVTREGLALERKIQDWKADEEVAGKASPGSTPTTSGGF